MNSETESNEFIVCLSFKKGVVHIIQRGVSLSIGSINAWQVIASLLVALVGAS